MTVLSSLPDASGEEWSVESPCVESDASWRPAAAGTPALDRLISRQTPARRRGGRADRGARADSSALRHVMAASDPVNAVAGGSDWRAETALREFAHRTRRVSESAVAAVLSDDPLSEDGARAFEEVCAAVGVGLIVQGPEGGVRVVRLCEHKNVWLRRGSAGGAWDAVAWCKAPVGADRARALLAHKSRERAADPAARMSELRSIAESCGLPRPLPRSKKALADLILSEGA